MTAPPLRRPIPGISNLRDLGGYAVQGGSLRWHTLYRSNEISTTDADTLSRLQMLGIRTLCDFRDDKQKQKVPIDLSISANAKTIATPISVSVLIRSALSGEKLTGTNARKILADALDPQTAGMHPVRTDLTTNINAIVGHAFDKLLQQAEVLLSLRELVRIQRQVQHPAVYTHGFRRHAQEIRRRSIEIPRRTGETNLMREQFIFRIRPVDWFLVVVHVYPNNSHFL